ncbi:DUF1080 domain-containing protein [Pontixanthobacter gangjinensis]|uniref:DUF1080 domain-containing protein n=1 Tax=Christiangramia aestuarii TaxID=1028746 RepID=A0A7K1LP64_9FLAO|nr:DUF1080 domain-containing protein [Christiangramia aestuarii]MUP42543.1 DUF1080 domain-containing protein [Christiangramia aestuarii]
MKKLMLIGCSLLIFSACKNESEKAEETELSNTEEMESTKENAKDEWQPLFNGEDLEGWKAYNRDSISGQWTVENGAIAFAPAEGDQRIKEYLITEDEFENFELSLEWKISEGGNSGIMWGVKETDKYDEPYFISPEIQVLDNQNHPDAKNGPTRTAGALYDMVPPSKDVTKPAGQWNKEVIHINYDENIGWVELNGTRITEFPLQGEKWEEMVENSKFKDWEDFGSTRKGKIAFQDHDDKVWFRNIKIKEL